MLEPFAAGQPHPTIADYDRLVEWLIDAAAGPAAGSRDVPAAGRQIPGQVGARSTIATRYTQPSAPSVPLSVSAYKARSGGGSRTATATGDGVDSADSPADARTM